MTFIDIFSVSIRALSFIAMLQAAGTVLFLSAMSDHVSLSKQRLWQLARLSALAGVVLVIIHHLLEATRMADSFSGMLDLGLQQMTLSSNRGVTSGMRIVGLLLILSARNGKNNVSTTMALIGATCVCVAFTFMGHTSVHETRWLLAPLLLIHLLVIAFWFGALLPLWLACKYETSHAASLAAAFSRLAAGTVPLIAVAGLLMAWVLLPNVAALKEPYGLLLLGKSLIFCVLMALAALNKWRLGPALASGSQVAAKAFQRSVLIEYMLIIAVLAMTAVMTGMFSPES